MPVSSPVPSSRRAHRRPLRNHSSRSWKSCAPNGHNCSARPRRRGKRSRRRGSLMKPPRLAPAGSTRNESYGPRLRRTRRTRRTRHWPTCLSSRRPPPKPRRSRRPASSNRPSKPPKGSLSTRPRRAPSSTSNCASEAGRPIPRSCVTARARARPRARPWRLPNGRPRAVRPTMRSSMAYPVSARWRRSANARTSPPPSISPSAMRATSS